jgi:hypothetical protein
MARPSIARLLISDGRDEYLMQTLESATKMLPEFDQHIHIDDREHQLGFGGAIRAGWEQVETDYVFHLEQDFTFNVPVDLDGMVALLERQPHLAQVALKRQPWNREERRAGGIVELHPHDFTERTDGQATWTEHRRFFTTNPSVYPSELLTFGWPDGDQSEGMFTHRLLRDPQLRFAFWGGKFDPPTVHHIGDVRSGNGY